MNKKTLIKGAVFGLLVGSIANYLFNKKTGDKNRAKIKSAADKLMKRLSLEIGAMSTITKKHYEGLVAKVVNDLKKDKEMNAEAWDAVAEELKARWALIEKQTKKMMVEKVQKAKKSLITKK